MWMTSFSPGIHQFFSQHPVLSQHSNLPDLSGPGNLLNNKGRHCYSSAGIPYHIYMVSHNYRTPSAKWQNVGKRGPVFGIFSLLNSERICKGMWI